MAGGDDSGREYLVRHRLPSLIDGAIGAVIKERPADPQTFIADFMGNKGEERKELAKAIIALVSSHPNPVVQEPIRRFLAAEGLAGYLPEEEARNSAFVFIKPHANTPAVRELAKQQLVDAGIKVLSEGEVKAEVIDEKKLIDQHYHAIASKATMIAPKDLNVPSAKFQEKFGLSWEDALKSGKVTNALEACKRLNVSGAALGDLWNESRKKDKFVKLGGGFYCGLLEAEGQDPIYTFNGFFMSMREKFTKPGGSIHYYVVDWNPADLSWAKFRGELLGPTNPEQAPPASLRGKVFKDWEKLGLPGVPNALDNGVHASASPFEGLAERLNWLSADVEQDSYGSLALRKGLKPALLKEWSVDPRVPLDAEGTKGSLFDALEDLDAVECLNKMKELGALTPQ
eukprot:Hpha_TRINITY_DN12096_c0_g2::TRINITY_DN12096_c0_g2_i1::g.141224::m.141224